LTEYRVCNRVRVRKIQKSMFVRTVRIRMIIQFEQFALNKNF